VQTEFRVLTEVTEKGVRDEGAVEQWLGDSAVVVSDEALYAPGGIEEWMNIAKVLDAA
jgi:hypothetical protein